VTADYPPTVLLHGDKDTDVPHHLSVRMAEALEAAGVEHKMYTLEGAGHGLLDAEPAQKKKAYDEAAAFFLRHLMDGK